MLKKWIAILASTLLLNACANQNHWPSQNWAANVYQLPPLGDDVVGENKTIITVEGDTLAKLAQQYDVGFVELTDANPGLSPNKLPAGTAVVIPTAYILPPKAYRQGIVINIAELRLYYFDNTTVRTFPVALGRDGWYTPLGKTAVKRTQAAPTWHPPASIRRYYLQKYHKSLPQTVGPGPNNPLGPYAIYLNIPGYLIHGTNDPASIGRLASSGCIRMYNQDVSRLYPYIAADTPVNIIYYPVKAGWKSGQLYLEAHTPIRHEEGMYSRQQKPFEMVIAEASEGRPLHFNLAEASLIVKQHDGMVHPLH